MTLFEAGSDCAGDGVRALAPAPEPSSAAAEGAKRCTRCKDVKPLSQFCRDPTKKIGYQSWCKLCYREHHEKRAMSCSGLTESLCNICKCIKPAAEFIKDARRPTGLDARCKECRRAHNVLMRSGFLQPEKRCAGCGEVKPSTEYKVVLLNTLAAAMSSGNSAVVASTAVHLVAPVPALAGETAEACLLTAAGTSPEAEHAADASGTGDSTAAEAAAAAGLVQGVSQVGPAAGAGAGSAARVVADMCRSCLDRRRREQSAQRTLQPTVASKCCVRCQRVKPAAEFIRDTRKKTGLGPRCKRCEQEYVREKRARKAKLEQERRLQEQAVGAGGDADSAGVGAAAGAESGAGGTTVAGNCAGQQQRPSQRKLKRQPEEGTRARGQQSQCALTDISRAGGGAGAHGAVSSSTSPAACGGMEVDAPCRLLSGLSEDALLGWPEVSLGPEQVLPWLGLGGAAWLESSSAERKRGGSEDGEASSPHSPQRKRRARLPSRSSRPRQGAEASGAAWVHGLPCGSAAMEHAGAWGTSDAFGAGPGTEAMFGLGCGPSNAQLPADVAAALSALCAWAGAPLDMATLPATGRSGLTDQELGASAAVESLACLGAANASDLVDAPVGHCYDSEFESECFDLSAAVAAVAEGGAVLDGSFRSLLPELSPLRHSSGASFPPEQGEEPAAAGAAAGGMPVLPHPSMHLSLPPRHPARALSRGTGAGACGVGAGAPVDADVASAFWSFRLPGSDQLCQRTTQRRPSEADGSDALQPHQQQQWWWCQEAQECSGEAHQPMGRQLGAKVEAEAADALADVDGEWFLDSSDDEPKQGVSGSGVRSPPHCGAGSGGREGSAGGWNQELLSVQHEVRDEDEEDEEGEEEGGEEEGEQEEEQTVIGAQLGAARQQQQQQPSLPSQAAEGREQALAQDGHGDNSTGGRLPAHQAPEQQARQHQRKAVSVSSIRGPSCSSEPMVSSHDQAQAGTSSHIGACWDVTAPSHAMCPTPEWDATMHERARVLAPLLPAARSSALGTAQEQKQKQQPAAASYSLAPAAGAGGVASLPGLAIDSAEQKLVGEPCRLALARSESVEEFSEFASLYLRSYEQPDAGLQAAEAAGAGADGQPGAASVARQAGVHDLAAAVLLGADYMCGPPMSGGLHSGEAELPLLGSLDPADLLCSPS